MLVEANVKVVNLATGAVLYLFSSMRAYSRTHRHKDTETQTEMLLDQIGLAAWILHQCSRKRTLLELGTDDKPCQNSSIGLSNNSKVILYPKKMFLRHAGLFYNSRQML